MKYLHMLCVYLLATASTVWALDPEERSFFGLTALESSKPHLTGEGFTVGVSDTEFDVTHPGLGWTGGNDYTYWFNNQTYIPQLTRSNPRIFMTAHREFTTRLAETMRHGTNCPDAFSLPITMNNPLKPMIWGYHGTWVSGTAASGARGPANESLGAAPKARLVLAGDTESFYHLLSMVPDVNPNRTVVMNRSFTGWSYIDGVFRRNAGVIGVNAAGNSFSSWSSDRMSVGGNSPHRASVRWSELAGYDLIVSGLTLDSSTTAHAASSGSQRNQESIFTDYVVKTIGYDGVYDTLIGGTSLASPLMAGGATLVQQAYMSTHPGQWLRVSQMDRILKRSGKFVDDVSTRLRYPVADFAAAVALAETYAGDPSFEPNFSTNLPVALRVNSTANDPHFLDPRYFRVSTSYGANDMLDYTTPSNHNGVIHVTGNRGGGRVSVALRNGWGDLARVNFSEPGKKLVMAFDYDTNPGSVNGEVNEFYVGIREMFASAQFMNFDQSDDNLPNGRLAFRIFYNRGDNSARIDLLQSSEMPVVNQQDKYAVWQRNSWSAPPLWDSAILATAYSTNLHKGVMPRVEVSFTSARATFRLNNQVLIDAAHTAPQLPLTRSTPYLHFQNGSANARQRLGNFAVSTAHGSQPVVSIEKVRDRAVEGVTGPTAGGLFTITRTGATNQPLTVYYSVAGTAANGGDCTFLPGFATIPAGVAGIELAVNPLNDLLQEAPETVIVNLSAHASYLVNPAYNSETVTIVDKSDADGDGLWNWDEDVNRNGDLSDDDLNGNMLPNYLDHLDRARTNNIAPIASAGASRSTTGTVAVALDGRASSDPDGQIMSYQWYILPGAGNGPVLLEQANTPQPTVRWTEATTNARTIRVSVLVTDNDGATASATTTVTQAAGQVFNKIYPQVYFRGTANGWGTTLMSLVSNNTWQIEATFAGASGERYKFDVYGDWSVNFGDANNDGIADQGAGDIAITQGAGTYRIWFNDQTRRYSATKVVINQRPIANAGADTSTYQMEPVTLNGSASYDPDGWIVAYNWSLIEGYEGPVYLTGAESATPAVQWTAPTISSRVARLQLVVTDNSGATATSSVKVTQTSTIVYGKTYPQVYFRGTANGWGTTAMTLVSNYTWQIETTFSSGSNDRLKFDVHGDWSVNFGDNNKDGIAEQNGGDIAIAQGAGTYRIWFNDQTKRYGVTKLVVNQPPVANAGPNQTVGLEGGTVSLDGSASYDPDGSIIEYSWTQSSGPFAIISYAHPGNPGATVVILSRTNNADYTFSLRVTDNSGAMSTSTVAISQRPAGFNKTFPQVYFRGTANGWGTTAMDLVSNFTWQIETTFSGVSGDRFKFDVYGNWTMNFGDHNKDGIAEQDGVDIAITQGAGTYRIWFNDQTKRYGVTKTGGSYSRDYSSMSVAGTMNNWNPAANNMQVIADYTWSGTFVLSGNAELKFAANGAWGSNWGDNNQPGTSAPLNGDLESNGGNIRLLNLPGGTYRITMHERTRAYSVALVAGSEMGVGRLLVGWENRYQLDLLQAEVASADHDLDGLTNLDEYHLGTHPYVADTDGDGHSDSAEIVTATDPLDDTSRLEVSTTVTDDQVVIAWDAQPNRAYRLEMAGELDGPWTPLTPWKASGQHAMSMPSADFLGYFRVQVGSLDQIGTTRE